MGNWDFGISEELAMVEQTILRTIRSEEPLLTEISQYVLGSGGKRIRPTVTLLAFRAVGGKDRKAAAEIAAALELIHNATLIHDDINDGGYLRRGQVAAHRKFGVHHALVTGDFLFTKAFLLGGRFGGQVVEIAADACAAVAAGEMQQRKHSRDPTLSREEYVEIIRRKTAWLISGGAKLGALLGGGTLESIAALGEYGLDLGTAFQIVDDVLDMVGDPAVLGKPLGVDIREGNMTLPTILAANNGDREELVSILTKKRKSQADVERGRQLIVDQGGVEEALGEARAFGERAKEDLAILPPSPDKVQLMRLVDFVLERRS